MADTTIPLFGTGIGTKSPNVSAQMRINLYADVYNEEDKTKLALFSRPGLTKFSQVQGSLAGIVGDFSLSSFYGGEWLLIAGAGATDPNAVLWRINGAGQSGNASFTPDDPAWTQTGQRVRGANNGTSAVWVDGTWVYYTDASNNSFATDLLTVTNYPNAVGLPSNAQSICYVAQRFVVDDPAHPGRFYWSDPDDGTSWPALNFSTAESNPDPLSCVFEAWGTLLLIGTQTTEFWSPAAAGASGQQPFIRVGGANIQWGTNAVDTVRKCNDTVMFLGRNQGGSRQVVQLQGYTATVVSTADIEWDIQNDPAPDAATALFYVSNGHPFYILNLSTHSWAYDIRTGTWQKFTTDDSRYAGQWEAAAFGQIIVTDYRDGRIYKVDPSVYTDDGIAMVREVVSKHAWANLDRLSCQEIVIDCETGLGSTDGTAPTSPQLMLSWSKDGGHTWGNEVWQALGPVGNYLGRAVWRMLGRSRDWIFKLRVTDAVKVVIIGAAARFG
jgi:hypothetical protein